MKLSLPFGKKKTSKTAGASLSMPPSGPAPLMGTGRSPISRVKEMSSQGLSEPEIIRALRTEGYSPVEVDRAMKDALRTAVKPAPMEHDPAGPAPLPEPMSSDDRLSPLPAPASDKQPRRKMLFPEDEAPPASRARSPPEPPFTSDVMEGIRKPGPELPEIPGMRSERGMEPDELEDDDLPIPPIRRKASKRERSWDRRREIEEATEGIVEEKIDEFRREVDDVTDRFRELSNRINRIEADMHRMQGEKKNEIGDIRTRIDDYKESIVELSAKMESIEKAMTNSLTPMMQSLRSLTDTIKAMKAKK